MGGGTWRKKNKAFMLNRKQYMQIRKMDHCQLSAWVEAVYKNAFKDGRESEEGLGETEMKDVLLSVKGIGEKKAQDIMNAINSAVNKKNEKGAD